MNKRLFPIPTDALTNPAPRWPESAPPPQPLALSTHPP